MQILTELFRILFRVVTFEVSQHLKNKFIAIYNNLCYLNNFKIKKITSTVRFMSWRKFKSLNLNKKQDGPTAQYFLIARNWLSQKAPDR